MTPSTCLRTASILTLIHSVLHTIGGVFGKPVPGAQQTVASVMRSTSFPVIGGGTRTFWDFYHGMGLAVTVFLTLEAVVFWQLAALARKNPSRLRPMLVTFLMGYLALGVNSELYFFSAPVATEIAIALFLGIAILQSRTEKEPAQQVNRMSTGDLQAVR